MNLTPAPEQTAFAATLHDLLADGDRTTWERLAHIGVTGLLVPARWGGGDGTPADLVVAAEELGHHATPGPVAASVAAVPALLIALGDDALCDKWLPELAAGRVVASLAGPPWLPLAEEADLILLTAGDTVQLARPGRAHASMDPSRRLVEVTAAGTLATGAAAAVERAVNLGALTTAAQLLGAGRALLETSVEYARTRRQFGRAIGSFQAVQHLLADVAVGLEFARPLLYAAAVTGTARDVSAAKVACGDAAHRAARAALQVHGAIGYTHEHGLGRWLTKVRVLELAWGTSAQHRARLMAELTR
ncbi:acyl-CoA dehydrogenase family protein [Paractinoplanes rishiriensis]|uniref:Acyl-CoA dehydrogenase n=1 Tax=Paractinoplanes rishiriensis TaxID=1050105 RepID=A0A919MT38_9ACTN|nr:acyl-CoA dehydrogenase [Actinoplanes rishiriensis]GIE94358.1 acyl-CoA dehydrogenase [Actinoplanes rishiriensis]